jgi:hypothetical protein
MESALYLVPELAPIAMVIGVLRTRLAVVKEREGGYTTETVVITALLAAAALAVVGAIIVKVTATGSKIKTE